MPVGHVAGKSPRVGCVALHVLPTCFEKTKPTRVESKRKSFVLRHFEEVGGWGECIFVAFTVMVESLMVLAIDAPAMVVRLRPVPRR